MKKIYIGDVPGSKNKKIYFVGHKDQLDKIRKRSPIILLQIIDERISVEKRTKSDIDITYDFLKDKIKEVLKQKIKHHELMIGKYRKKINNLR